MKNKKSKIYIFRIMVELLALVLVIVLTVNNKLQMWFAVFFVGVILSTFAGRFFCGWVCPMNTLFRGVNWIYSKLKIRRFKTPGFLQHRSVRYFFLTLFVFSVVFMKINHIQINVLLYLILASIVVTLFFSEEFWHRQICPFGTILSLTSRKSPIALRIDEEGCTSCGICQKHCPSQSIETLENKKRYNEDNECLICYQCVDVCPTAVCKVGKK